MSAVTCSGRVMFVCSSCPQLSIQVAKGRENTQKSVIPPTQTLVSYLKTSAESMS